MRRQDSFNEKKTMSELRNDLQRISKDARTLSSRRQERKNPETQGSPDTIAPMACTSTAENRASVETLGTGYFEVFSDKIEIGAFRKLKPHLDLLCI